MLIEASKRDLHEFENVNGAVESKPIRLLSLFSGIGAFEKALDRENIPYELASFCEIDKFAVKSYCAVHGMSEDKNLGDISKVDTSNIPDCDLVTFGFPCVTGDTLITTAEGYKQIKEIKEGEMVLTHANEYKKVERFIPQGKKEIWHINAMGTHGIDTTENHRYYAREKYRKGHLGIRTFTEPAWVECKNLNNNYYLGTPVNSNSIPFKDSSIDLDFTDDTLWYLAGRYLGDGWLKKRNDRATNTCGIVICCGKHKANDFERKIDNKYHYTKSETRTTINYIFSSIAMAKLFSMMGHGAANKEIPPCFIDMPVEYLKKVVEGYLDSDGAKTQGLCKITTVSPKLVYSAAQAISKVYHRPVSVYLTKRPSNCVIEGRTVNQKDSYQLTFKPHVDKQDKAFYENGYIWFPIRSVTNTHKMKDVYDITVETHHSFIANNCIAHNCQDVSVAGNQKGIVAGQTRSGLLYEALRIIEAKKPPYAICENVKNLVGKKFKPDFDKLLFMLDELGYNSYWQVLNAKDYGIPQNRERVFVISIRKDIDNGTFKFPEKFPLEIRLKDMLEDDVDDKFYLTPKNMEWLAKHNANHEAKGTGFKFKPKNPETDTASTLRANASFAPTDNAVIEPLNPSPDGTCRTIKAQYAKTSEANYKNTGSRGATGVVKIEPAYESVTQVNDNYAMLNGGRIGKMHDISRRAYYEDGVAPTIHTSGGGNQEPKVIVNERMYRQAFETLSENDCKASDVITPYNKKVVVAGTCPTLTTRPEGFKTATLVVTDQQIVDSIPDSNSYNKRKAQEMLDKKGYLPEFHVPYNSSEVKETAPTLTTCSGHFAGSGSVMYKHDFRIRKLTPKECWRLMGFDDSDFDKAKAAGISNSQLYRQAGNSIVVNVLQYIFRNLLKGGE